MIRTFALGFGLALAGSACAQSFTWSFTLTGLQEVPPVMTTGTAQAVVELNAATNEVMWHLIVTGLEGDFTAAHFHQAPVGVNGPVVLNISNSWMPDPGTNRSGHMIGMSTVSSAVRDAMIAGNIYINVHTSRYPGGEIRGQVVPTAGAMALLALGGMASLLRRR